MTQATWQKFLEDNHACTPGYEWAKNQPGVVSVWSSCPDGSWLLWLAFTEAGDDLTKRRAILSELLNMFADEGGYVTDPGIKQLYLDLQDALNLWITDPTKDPAGLSLSHASGVLLVKVGQTLRELATLQATYDPQYQIAIALHHMAQAALSDNGPMAAVSAQHGLGSLIAVWTHHGLVYPPGEGKQQAQRGADMVRLSLKNYGAVTIPAIAELRGI